MQPTKKKPKMSTKFKVVNIVAVMTCGFQIKLRKVWESKYIVAINEVNPGKGNVYTQIKVKGVTKPVTIFYNGNMITVGNKHITEARRNLELTKKYLAKFKLKHTNKIR